MHLSVEDLACARGGVPVLQGLNLRVEHGEALILRGPNGSGKTTLLRTLAGLTPPVAGRIDVTEGAIAYAGHADGLKAQASVIENLTFWARVFRTDRTARAMETFALTDLADRRAGELSAGQKRRLGLARLIVTGRPIWCLDEPTVSLDTTATARFAEVVEAHLAEGGIAMIATHIDMGLSRSRMLDVGPYRARAAAADPDPFAADLF